MAGEGASVRDGTSGTGTSGRGSSQDVRGWFIRPYYGEVSTTLVLDDPYCDPNSPSFDAQDLRLSPSACRYR